MIEKVARAYAEFAGVAYEPDRAFWDGAARVGIEAMREPTGEMLDSGVAFALNVQMGGEYRWSDYIRDLHIAMTNAALADPVRRVEG